LICPTGAPVCKGELKYTHKLNGREWASEDRKTCCKDDSGRDCPITPGCDLEEFICTDDKDDTNPTRPGNDDEDETENAPGYDCPAR
jgi:hypothetical protein